MKKSNLVIYFGFCFLLVFFLIAGTGCKSNAAAAGTTAAAETTTAGITTETTAAPNSGTTAATTASGAVGQAVTIQSNSFNPASLTIKVGDTVTWTNNDSYAHTVTSDNGAFDSGSIASGGTFSFTFKTAGTFSYHCSIHTFMTAKIIVQ